MAKIVITRRAEAELRAIWRYIAADNPDAADQILLAIDDRLDLLREFPDLGVSRGDVGPSLRMLIEGSYLLFYEHRATDGVVEIISIVDGRRNLKNWL